MNLSPTLKTVSLSENVWQEAEQRFKTKAGMRKSDFNATFYSTFEISLDICYFSFRSPNLKYIFINPKTNPLTIPVTSDLMSSFSKASRSEKSTSNRP